MKTISKLLLLLVFWMLLYPNPFAFGQSMRVILTPADRFGMEVINGSVNAAPGDSVINDSTGVGVNELLLVVGDSMVVGSVFLLTSGAYAGTFRYISNFLDTLQTGKQVCRLYLSEVLPGKPTAGDTYKLFYGPTAERIRKTIMPSYAIAGANPFNYESWTGWAVNEGDSIYSEGIKWSKYWGGDYTFSMWTDIDTLQINITEPCSTDVSVWLEISEDSLTWIEPDGYTAVHPNIIDLVPHWIETDIPPGTPYFRYGATGNLLNNNTRGLNFLRMILHFSPK